MKAETLKQLLELRRELEEIEGKWNGDADDVAGDNACHAGNALVSLGEVITEYNQIV